LVDRPRLARRADVRIDNGMRYGLQGTQATTYAQPFAPRRWDATLVDTRLSSNIRHRAANETVRTDAAEAQGFVEEIGALELTLAVNLDGLAEAMKHVAYDPSVRAAAEIVGDRLRDLEDLREALGEVHLAAVHPALSVLFMRDAPLAEYLRGLEAWCIGLVRAFEQLVLELRIPAPCWGTLRRRIDGATQFYLPELQAPIGRALAEVRARRPTAVGAARKLDCATFVLFRVAARLAESIQLRFG
jgi:hypothetical protein